MLPVEVESRMDAFREAVARGGAELLEVQFRRMGSRNVLVFIVDKAGGITLDECADANRRLGEYLDREAEAGASLWQGAYFLEVNSPGLDRPLRTPADFRRASGERLIVHWRKEDGKTATSVGTLETADETGIEILTDSKGSVLQKIGYSQVTKARREIK